MEWEQNYRGNGELRGILKGVYNISIYREHFLVTGDIIYFSKGKAHTVLVKMHTNK